MSSSEKNPAANSAPGTDAIHNKNATELATLISTKQLSSREVVQAHLDRIRTVNPKVNAIVTLMAQDALKFADAADKAVASGARLGPFHGIPFTIKDAIDTAGVLTQRGSKIFAGNILTKMRPSSHASRTRARSHWQRPTFPNSRPGKRRTTLLQA